MSAKKSRFDGLDTAAMVSHIKRTMLGFKLANVYDGNTLGVIGTSSSGGGGPGDGAKGVYMFKLADPSGGGGSSDGPGATAANADDTNGTASSGAEDDDEMAPPLPQDQNLKRTMLLIESGVRFHPTTHYTQSTIGTSSSPSPFAMKLRKHLRNLRLENVTQLGNLDRVIDFRFGSGSYAHHLILELYSQGNIILSDGEYRILALLRTHQYKMTTNGTAGKEGMKVVAAVAGVEDGKVEVRVGNIYPVTFATTLTVVGTNDEGASVEENMGLLNMNASEAYEWAKTELSSVQNRAVLAASSNEEQTGKMKTGGKQRKKAMHDSLVLKALLLKPNSGVYHYGPSLIEHCILTAGIDPAMKLTFDNIECALPDASWTELLSALRCEGEKVIQNLTLGEGGGYILYKPKPSNDNGKTNESSLLPSTMVNHNLHSDKTLLEFQPHLLHQHKDQQSLKYATFTVAVDVFFSHISYQRIAAKADAAEAVAHDRLAKIKVDQQRRIEGLVNEQEQWKDSARLVETHAEDVDRALGVINSALESGMNWDALEQLVIMEQGNNNPIALLIHKLLLDKDQVVMALPDVESWDESHPDIPPPIQLVTLSIKESAHGNARAMFSQYRTTKEKGEKTAEASTTALKAAEAKARQQLADAQKKKQQVQVAPQRRTYWFEKFSWFITSDNYLVVAGKDAQQNEQLVKRYLRPGDAYLHAEVHGAATCILRAKRRRRKDGKTQVVPLSDQALREAGHFTICRSAAWSSKMVTSAYWVESHQVSKTAPSGEYLTVGSFMIRGRKNFLPPSSLEMGLGVLFRLGDETSVARHAHERRDFALIEQEQISVQQEEELDGTEMQQQLSSFSFKKEESDTRTDYLTIDENLVEDHNTNDERRPEKEETNPAMDDDHEHMTSAPIAESELNEVTTETSSSPNAEENHVSFQTELSSIPPHETKKKENQSTRGKRSKLKRAKKRYNEQDDEDRELVMLALHGGESSKKGKQGKGSKIVASENATQLKVAEQTMALLVRDSQKVAEMLADNVQQILAKCVTVTDTNGSDTVRWSKFDAEALEQMCEMATLEEQLAAANRLLELSNATRIDNYSASLAGIIRTIKKHGVELQDLRDVIHAGDGKQRKSKSEKQVEKEAWREILAEDGIIEDNAEGEDRDVDDTAELGKLTGKPMAQDSILWAIPVCAPYSVLSKYTYRTKLTPGSVKRGKASKQAVEMFLRSEVGAKALVDEGTKRDLALIRLVNENEWVQAMIGDVRIASAGASKIAAKLKSRGKAKK